MSGQVIAHLSAPRFATYTNACNGDVARAFELYQDNTRLSGFAYTALHAVEVILRNAIDRELRVWNAKKTGQAGWAFHAAPLLQGVLNSEKLEDARSDAKRAARKKKRDATHDDVVAQMTLGTWRYLLPSRGQFAKQLLWDEAIDKSFPNRHGVGEEKIAQTVSIIYDLRNRVAHHEPIFALDLRGKRRAMKDVLQMIDTDVRKWFNATDEMSPALDVFYTKWPEFKRFN